MEVSYSKKTSASSLAKQVKDATMDQNNNKTHIHSVRKKKSLWFFNVSLTNLNLFS